MSRSLATQNHYAVLEVKPTATHEELKASYRRLALLYHPDKNKGSNESTLKTQKINEAWEVLGDSTKRVKYDASQIRAQTAAPRSTHTKPSGTTPAASKPKGPKSTGTKPSGTKTANAADSEWKYPHKSSTSRNEDTKNYGYYLHPDVITIQLSWLVYREKKLEKIELLAQDLPKEYWLVSERIQKLAEVENDYISLGKTMPADLKMELAMSRTLIKQIQKRETDGHIELQAMEKLLRVRGEVQHAKNIVEFAKVKKAEDQDAETVQSECILHTMKVDWWSKLPSDQDKSCQCCLLWSFTSDVKKNNVCPGCGIVVCDLCKSSFRAGVRCMRRR